MNRIVPIVLVALLAVGGGAYWLSNNQVATTEPEETVIATEDQASSEATEATEMADDGAIADMVLGSADAPITMIEYASFTCPHCASFHLNTFKQLKTDYIDTGKVRFVFREVYFDRFGLAASMVARCGGKERFFGITDLFFKGQSTWARGSDPTAIAAEIQKIGRLAGLGEETLKSCMQDQDQATALIAWYQANAEADDITATPSFVINGKKQPNVKYDELKKILDALL